MAGKYHLKKGANDSFHFNLKAGNGETILSSESYSSKAAAKNGIESVQKNSQIDDRYEKKTSSGGSPYFVLKAGNGEPIGKSEMYSSDSARDNGIESVKKNGATTEIDDDTE